MNRVSGQAGALAVHLHHRVVLAGDDVGVGHHHARARHPPRALDPQSAGGAEDAYDGGGGGADIGVAQDPAGRRGDVGARAVDLGEGVDARERVEDRPRRRQELVEALEHDRALDVVA